MTSDATFTTTLEATGGANVAIVVPDEVVTSFGRGQRVPVVVTVEGHRYATSVARMGGRSLVSFNAATRKATGRGAGDTVTVRLEVDDDPRTVQVPPALAAALAADPAAAAAWEALAPSRQKAQATSVADAKAEATRERRVHKVLAALR